MKHYLRRWPFQFFEVAGNQLNIKPNIFGNIHHFKSVKLIKNMGKG